jgi:hypothetical protein
VRGEGDAVKTLSHVPSVACLDNVVAAHRRVTAALPEGHEEEDLTPLEQAVKAITSSRGGKRSAQLAGAVDAIEAILKTEPSKVTPVTKPGRPATVRTEARRLVAEASDVTPAAVRQAERREAAKEAPAPAPVEPDARQLFNDGVEYALTGLRSARGAVKLIASESRTAERAVETLTDMIGSLGACLLTHPCPLGPCDLCGDSYGWLTEFAFAAIPRDARVAKVEAVAADDDELF